MLIKRCLFVNTRIHGIKSNNKDIPYLAVPSMEFHSNISKHHSLPNLATALTSILYLAVEETLYHVNIPGDIVKTLSKQSHNYFNSAYPIFTQKKKAKLQQHQKVHRWNRRVCQRTLLPLKCTHNKTLSLSPRLPTVRIYLTPTQKHIYTENLLTFCYFT